MNVGISKKTLGIVVIAVLFVLALLAIGALLFRINGLADQVSHLKTQNATLRAQVTAFDRTLCESDNGMLFNPSLQTFSFQSAGYERSYRVHTPANYDPSVRYPVILSFDGIDGSGARMESYSNLDSLPAIVVYPDSLPGKRGFTAWQGAPYSVDGERDIAFVRQLIETLPSQYCVDSTKIFAVGMSNGGSFATIVGCEMGNKVRAVASVSGAFYSTCTREQRTPSLLIIHSTTDGQVPFLGSPTRQLPKVQQWVERQATERKCNPEVTNGVSNSAAYYNWSDCSDESLLRFVVLRNQAHGWLATPPAQKEGIKDTAGYIWKFFEDVMYSN